MGMYDTVIVPCPKCKAEIKFQSKAGDCELYDYNYRSVPPDIVMDLKNKSACCSCGTGVVIDANICNIQMYIKDIYNAS